MRLLIVKGHDHQTSMEPIVGEGYVEGFLGYASLDVNLGSGMDQMLNGVLPVPMESILVRTSRRIQLQEKRSLPVRLVVPSAPRIVQDSATHNNLFLVQPKVRQDLHRFQVTLEGSLSGPTIIWERLASLWVLESIQELVCSSAMVAV